jgi:hypothetical protein
MRNSECGIGNENKKNRMSEQQKAEQQNIIEQQMVRAGRHPKTRTSGKPEREKLNA